METTQMDGKDITATEITSVRTTAITGRITAAEDRGEPTLRYAPCDDTQWCGELVRANGGDAGFDLPSSATVTVEPGCKATIPTNICIQPPRGMWGLILGRSSTFMKRGLYVNPGVIDEGYRGELLAVVENTGKEPVTVRKGERVVQLILFHLETPKAHRTQRNLLNKGDREDRGFGSTGE